MKGPRPKPSLTPLLVGPVFGVRILTRNTSPRSSGTKSKSGKIPLFLGAREGPPGPQLEDHHLPLQARTALREELQSFKDFEPTVTSREASKDLQKMKPTPMTKPIFPSFTMGFFSPP